jgi:hypothetical protein
MAQTRMKAFRLRPLTAAEQALTREVFGAGFQPGGVRILAQPIIPRPFTPGPWLIVYPTSEALTDFTQGSLGDQATLIHEMTHVWQAQRGAFLPWEKLKAGDSHASYVYDLDAQTFPQMNIEQQARLVEHDFVLSRQDRLLTGRPPPFPRALYDAQRVHWRTA